MLKIMNVFKMFKENIHNLRENSFKNKNMCRYQRKKYSIRYESFQHLINSINLGNKTITNK